MSIENDEIIVNKVSVKSWVKHWGGIRIADNILIGPNVSLMDVSFS